MDCVFINNTVSYSGGAITWDGSNGNILGSTFTDNAALNGGGLSWWGINGSLSSSTFTDNLANGSGGGVIWWGHGTNGTITNSSFINNTASSYGGAFCLDNGAIYCILTNCIFIGNSARWGGGVSLAGANGILSDSTFINNFASTSGGGISCWEDSFNSTIFNSTFINNTGNAGAILFWEVKGYIVNCNFINCKSISSNGIYAHRDLIITNGKGIVYAFVNGTLTGISIVVLNNETYYYPPNTNINFTNKNTHKLKT